jgi:hypothetical protein
VLIGCSPTPAYAEPSDGWRWQTAPVCHGLLHCLEISVCKIWFFFYICTRLKL